MEQGDRPGRKAVCAGQNGFTLLEVTVVVMIIGIVTGVMAFSITRGADDRRLEQFMGRLALKIRAAGEQAVIKGVIHGFDVLDGRCRFTRFRRTAKQWEIKEIASLDVPDGVTLELQTQGEKNKGVLSRMKVVFRDTGEWTPFVLYAEGPGGAAWMLDVGGWDAVQISRWTP